MAQGEEVIAGQKRGPGRPLKSDQRFEKKRKLSTDLSTPITSSVQSPTDYTPLPERRSNKLPSKVTESRPLPALPEPQSLALSNDEYQSIAASAVLQTSLERSRLRWVNEGVLERYWVKPESGKNARPPPPNNPELKWQKHKGPCRIRVEPHIFEVEVYVEEKTKPPAAPTKQYVPPAYQQGAYGQPYRQNQPTYGQQQQQQYYQNHTLPPIQQPSHCHPPANTLPPIGNMSQATTPRGSSGGSPSPAPQGQQDKKASPDPVISMLASRASSDPELKALMKEVATGNASQDQLKVFQNHIDELTKAINDKKKEEDEAMVALAAQAATQQNDTIQYDGAGDPVPPPYQQQQQKPYQPPASDYRQGHQQTWAPQSSPAPAPTSQPVILAFTTPGATEDRFLFPQNSILEALSPQHLLASFIVTRKGRDAVDRAGLDPDVEYWQAVTLMVEVAYNREHIIECVRKWVKPADEVKKHMEEVMERCTRAPDSYLALRLPFRGSAAADSDDVTTEGSETPLRGLEEKTKPKSSIKYVKKALKNDLAKKSEMKDEGGRKKPGLAIASSAAYHDSSKVGTEDHSKASTAAPEAVDDSTDAAPATETGRPRRAVRKSVRISEG